MGRLIGLLLGLGGLFLLGLAVYLRYFADPPQQDVGGLIVGGGFAVFFGWMFSD
jgi:hypothetical protein